MNKELELWEQVKEMLKASNDEATFNQTFAPITEIYKVQNNVIYLIVNNSLDIFRLKRFYLVKMNELLSQIAGESMSFGFISKAEAEEQLKSQQKETVIPTVVPTIIKKRNLRAEYTFSNFITGEANREAFTFSVKVAESPHVTINPFYIFGDVGLGKTHLMTAIGHYILENNPNANIVYTTAQQFVEDFYKAKNKNQKNTAFADEFDNYYRSADLFLVDDIQYLADRQGSQDEFFKLFEYLFENNKQIIVTSDRPANELNIMARLKSRFSWGMQTDIKKPNQLLREAILRGKLKFLISDTDEVPANVITYIAENFDENVRDLEGALRRFISYCVSFNIDFNYDNAVLALDAIISTSKSSSNNNTKLHIEKIKEIIAAYFNINVKDLASPSRKQEFVYARQLTVYILKTKYNQTLTAIGSALGGRDHATISHAFEKIQEAIKTDSNIKEDVDNLISNLDKQYKI